MRPLTIVSVLDSSAAVKDPAVTRALSLARWYESTLHVVHVRRGRASADSADREELDRWIARETRGRSARETVIAATLSGRPVRAIADYSRRVGADLVVVGDHARRSGGYWPAGSFAVALGKAVTSPTLVVPDDPPPRDGAAGPFRNILSAVDFSEASFGALSAALTLAQQSGGRLRLLHVLNGFPYDSVYGGSEALRLGRVFRASTARIDSALRALIPADALNWSEIDAATVMGRTDDAILAQVSHGRADLIVLGLPRRSRLGELLGGSTVHKVVRRATAPVLLVPGPSMPPAPVAMEEGASWSSEASGTFMEQVRAEYAAMRGLSLTLPQAQRLWTVDRQTCQEVFSRLVRRGVLRVTAEGRFILA